jgi:Helix-turn-helix domain
MTVSDRFLRVPEVARRLNMYGPDVYELIRTGKLDAGKGKDGLVYVPEAALRDFEERRKSGTSR